MIGRALLAATALAALPGISAADPRETIGWGRSFNNDYFGDNKDRWRTGSYTFSWVRGRSPYDGTPVPFGDILEYRFRSEIIAPLRGSGAPGDRPYAGIFSAGIHTHFDVDAVELSLGADAVAIGPSTGISAFQEWFHDLFSYPAPQYLDGQLPDQLHLGVTAEAALPVRVGPELTLRPFVEVQTGVEEIARIGGDLIFGKVGHDDLLLHDPVTGQIYRGTEGPGNGVSFVAGLDWAAVGGSVYLPEDDGYAATDQRLRARGGVHWQIAPGMSFFYGLTWLSEEFVGQPEGQLIGSLKLNLNF